MAIHSRSKEVKPYQPNSVPKVTRVWNLLLALYLIGWGCLGLYTSSVDLWGRRIKIAKLQGGPAYLMAFALICGALVLIAEVIDHYDKRNNESLYAGFRWFLIRLGWCLAVFSLLSHVLVFLVGTHVETK